jgi:hypothetical protein
LKPKGEVQDLNAGAKTFRIGALTIDYTDATRVPHRPGTRAVYRGERAAAGAGPLMADRLELEEDIGSAAFETIDPGRHCHSNQVRSRV